MPTYPYTERIYIERVTHQAKKYFLPILKVNIKYGRRTLNGSLLATVDSGADRNLFPADAYRALGQHVETGLEVRIGGIGGEIIAYEHTVNLIFDDFHFRTKVCFSDEIKNPLLGRSDFFKHFSKVLFNETEKEFELIS